MKDGNDDSGWRHIFYIALASSFFTSIYRTMDNISVHNLIICADSFTAASAYFVIGAWLGVLTSYLFVSFWGKRVIDQEFSSIQKPKHNKMHAYAFGVGILAALGTIFNLWGNQFGDPSSLIALSMAITLFTTLYDVFKKHITLRRVIIPTALIFLGSITAAYNGSLRFTFMEILLVGIFSNMFYAIAELAEKNGINAGDGANFFFWRFLWLATSGTLLLTSIALIRHTQQLLFATILGSLEYSPWFILTMFFVFIGVGLKFAAKKTGAVSIILLILSSQIIFGLLITIIGHFISPGIFGLTALTPDFLITRVIGVALLICGLLLLSRQNPHQISP